VFSRFFSTPLFFQRGVAIQTDAFPLKRMAGVINEAERDDKKLIPIIWVPLLSFRNLPCPPSFSYGPQKTPLFFQRGVDIQIDIVSTKRMAGVIKKHPSFFQRGVDRSNKRVSNLMSEAG